MMTSEYRPPSGLKQQANKNPPQAPCTIPLLNQHVKTNSQDPVAHWCWSPTKNLGAGERGGDRCRGILGENGLTTAADGLGGPNMLGKKNGEGPLPQNFSSLHMVWGGSTLKSLSWTRCAGRGRTSTPAAMASASEAESSRESTEKPRLLLNASLFKTLYPRSKSSKSCVSDLNKTKKNHINK